MTVRGSVLGAWALAVAVGAAAGQGPVAQEAKPEVVVQVAQMKQVVVRAADGREAVQLQPASSSGPGDTLVYQISYTNKGTAPAYNPRIVDPIPAGTRLVPGSCEAGDADLTVSLDGGKTFEPYPVRRAVKRGDGTTVQEEVDPTLYTHLRWVSRESLAPGATRTATYKVIVR